MGDKAYTDGTWQSSDELTLHYRDYAGRDAKDDGRPPILCIPGLTRNARDFEPVADAIAGEWRVIVVELRGRGESDYAKDPATYVTSTYVADIVALLDYLKLEKVVAFGTSLGGIITMLMARLHPGRFVAAILNDIGPVVEEEGLAKIRDHVGYGRSFPTWMHAARAMQETSAHIYPDFGVHDWLTFAKRLMVVSNSGRISFDYDMKIAEQFAPVGEEPADMWPLLRALGDIPVLGLRGELSDILSPETFAKMAQELPQFVGVTVPRVGHVPTLEEPVAQAAIAALLEKIA
ncbi:alpha/beta fold hydrolase [Erythrobacter sp. EC-HK427]|uniref:alpha/beta fold hydrolase n=1 Tax=Erythrobacter sp. EC-HK427 TaxID=2038396 RepID=UPI0012553831|nr:alpha/beta hydrolase [Erythrobacter sp. EC-HK427]VVT12020.1 Alpha/beta hydrolase [Erythrobacter sp. EC-HK427]